MDILIKYLIRLLPGIVIAGAFFMLIPRRLMLLRLMGYLFVFIFIRDAMTPAGLWSFGSEGFFWIRFIDNPLVLSLTGISSVFIVVLMNRLDPQLKSLIVWFRGARLAGAAAGLLGASVVILPLFIVYMDVPMADRGGTVGLHLLGPLLLTTMLGNLYEEVLFRGYLQGFLETVGGLKPLRAALVSGVFFGFGHVFLALTVTGIGFPLLIFALYEGIIAALVRMKFGVMPSTLTHGAAIFFLASGLI